MKNHNNKKQKRLDDVRGGFGKRLRDEDETEEARSSTQGVGEEKTHNDDSNAAAADDDDGITDLTAGDGADSESHAAGQGGGEAVPGEGAADARLAVREQEREPG